MLPKHRELTEIALHFEISVGVIIRMCWVRFDMVVDPWQMENACAEAEAAGGEQQIIAVRRNAALIRVALLRVAAAESDRIILEMERACADLEAADAND